VDSPAPLSRFPGGRAMKRGAALLLGALLTAAALGQESTKLESDAKRAFDSGRFREAGEKYARAAEAPEIPTDRKADLHLQSAWSFYIAGNSKGAREELKLAIGARPDLQVIPDFYSPDFASLAAAVRLEVAGANVPPLDVEELKRSARAKLADGKAEEALYDLKHADASKDPEVFRLIAEAHDRLGHTPEADAARRHAADLAKALVSSVAIGAGSEPAAPPTGGSSAALAPLLEAAEKALAAGDSRAATTAARQASEADPKSADAHRILADAALMGGQDADAEREYTASIVLDPGNPKAQYGLAVVAERQKKWNTAASLYRRALDLEPKNVPAALGLGRSMAELGDKSAARIALGRAIEIDPASAQAHNDFGVFLFSAGETDRAVEELMEAVRLAPSSATFHGNLGRAFRKKAMWREADRELSEAVRLAPNDAGSWLALGHVRQEQKKLEDAAVAFSTAASLDPLSEEAAIGLADTLAATGRLPEAETALAKSIESNEKSPILWNELGVVRVRRGNYAGAADAFRKALALDASLDQAKSNLVRAGELAALEKAAS